MRDITNEMLRYRECVCDIWNTYFRELEGGWHDFIPVQRELFCSLVLAQVFETHGVSRAERIVWVVPRVDVEDIDAL